MNGIHINGINSDINKNSENISRNENKQNNYINNDNNEDKTDETNIIDDNDYESIPIELRNAFRRISIPIMPTINNNEVIHDTINETKTNGNTINDTDTNNDNNALGYDIDNLR